MDLGGGGGGGAGDARPSVSSYVSSAETVGWVVAGLIKEGGGGGRGGEEGREA